MPEELTEVSAMQPYAPFTGVLLLPDKAFPSGTSPVTLGGGEVIAHIRWHAWTTRGRFEILDATGARELARGQAEGLSRRRYLLYGPAGEVLLHYQVGWFGPSGRCTVVLPTGVELTAKGNWSERRFVVTGPDGAAVARIVTTSRWLSLCPDSYAFEVERPVLSPVQAIGLAQCIRTAVDAQRRRRSNG